MPPLDAASAGQFSREVPHIFSRIEKKIFIVFENNSKSNIFRDDSNETFLEIFKHYAYAAVSFPIVIF